MNFEENFWRLVKDRGRVANFYRNECEALWNNYSPEQQQAICESIEKKWADLKIRELRKTSIIDMYEASGVRSITIRFSFVADDRTLTGEEVQAHIDTILKNLEESGVRLKLQ